jgi:hypothetical protein
MNSVLEAECWRVWRSSGQVLSDCFEAGERARAQTAAEEKAHQSSVEEDHSEVQTDWPKVDH